ncbi:MAG TPA: sulfite exporter TauE/SafE family protein [bacterium]|nr:sulfite exporter TauE/SafE family protein [bacterium]HEX68194.1 sulfite exporter TauE/SafE family protein [bacterium]
MYFPFAEVHVKGWVLPLLGFTAGVSSGFWGVGGGWVITPALFILGFPMNLAVGTSLSFIYAQAIVSSLTHKKLGNINVPLGLLLFIGMLPSVELGARVVDFLKNRGEVDTYLGYFYFFFLLLIFAFTFFESFKAQKKQSEEAVISWKEKFPLSLLPPFLSCRGMKVSIWSGVLVGILGGFFSGLMGIGGGIIFLPLMIYLLGLPTKMAVGTGLFNIMVGGAFGTFTHALKGNVDVLGGLLLLAGGGIGARIGALATKYAPGTKIRFLFSLSVGATAISVILRLKGYFLPAFLIILGVAGVMCAIVIFYLWRGNYEEKMHKMGKRGA